MRTATHIIQSALGDPAFKDIESDDARNVGRFRFFRARLSRPTYGGLPPLWYFAVLLEPEKPTGKQEAEDVLTHARDLIRSALGHKLEPLVLLSDDPNVNLADNLRFDGRNVFSIDREQLPGRSQSPKLPRSAPFLGAVRQKLSQSELSRLFFEPYRPGVPVEGWRFFGRRQELDRLVNTDQSFVIVGARQIGKTSLLKEVARRLRQDGASVHFISVQDLQSAEQVVGAIVRQLSVRDAEVAVRRQKAVNEALLQSVLKTIARGSGRVTLILDELGNVIQKTRRDDWRIMGAFREYAHSGKLQVIMSGFQEFFLKQIEDAQGPFVNFAEVMKLGVFSDRDVDEFLVEPLALWGDVRDHHAFRDLIISRVGRQPFLLQYLGRALFSKIFDRRQGDLESALQHLLTHEAQRVFDSPIEEVFYHASKPIVRYLFLQRCLEADLTKQDVTTAELNDAWVKQALTKAGYESNFDGRRLLLESMEMVGLTSEVAGNRSRQQILAPIIWQAVKAAEPAIEEHIRTFAEEMRSDDTPLRVGVRAEQA